MGWVQDYVDTKEEHYLNTLYACFYIFDDKYASNIVNGTNVFYSPMYNYYFDKMQKHARENNDEKSLKAIDEMLDKFFKELRANPLNKMILTQKAKRGAKYRNDPKTEERITGLKLEELREVPGAARLKCGNYRILIGHSKDYKKVLFICIFHRGEGYVKALDLYYDASKMGFNDILQKMSHAEYNKLRQKILIEDKRTLRK